MYQSPHRYWGILTQSGRRLCSTSMPQIVIATMTGQPKESRKRDTEVEPGKTTWLVRFWMSAAYCKKAPASGSSTRRMVSLGMAVRGALEKRRGQTSSRADGQNKIVCASCQPHQDCLPQHRTTQQLIVASQVFKSPLKKSRAFISTDFSELSTRRDGSKKKGLLQVGGWRPRGSSSRLPARHICFFVLPSRRDKSDKAFRRWTGATSARAFGTPAPALAPFIEAPLVTVGKIPRSRGRGRDSGASFALAKFGGEGCGTC